MRLRFYAVLHPLVLRNSGEVMDPYRLHAAWILVYLYVCKSVPLQGLYRSLQQRSARGHDTVEPRRVTNGTEPGGHRTGQICAKPRSCRNGSLQRRERPLHYGFTQFCTFAKHYSSTVMTDVAELPAYSNVNHKHGFLHVSLYQLWCTA